MIKILIDFSILILEFTPISYIFEWLSFLKFIQRSTSWVIKPITK